MNHQQEESIDLQASVEITAISPQLLVDHLQDAIAYYRDKLGFEVDFIYQDFYAGVSRDGFGIHLKCAPKPVIDNAQRRKNEHLDAYIGVEGVEALYNELQASGACIIKPLEDTPWDCKDFYVEDRDGHVLCFSEGPN